MDQLTLSFFGTFQATLGDKPLTNFRSAKVQGLLIYLALTQPQPHPRAVLATLFWPDEPETVANQNLRQSLFRLRQLLGDADSQPALYLLVTRSTVQFNAASNHALDVTHFLSHLANAQPEPAVALYRGDLLAGFTCDSPPFDEWLRQSRERLHRLALDALFDLTAQALARSDYQCAQRLARQQLTLEPWREEAHRQLIQTLFLLGERSAALVQVENCRAVLAAELGVAPSAETEALATLIRDAQPAPAPRSDTSAEVGLPRLTTPFVGRKLEHDALVQTYRRAKRDGLQVVTITGNAGIGKTRLTQQFLTWAATQGADGLVGRSFETSAGLSYQPITHLLRQRLERENAPEDLLADLWLSQITRLLPELRERYPDLPEPTQEEATAKQHLFEAVTRLGKALAERQPLVLWLDDWHWADSASLDMLHYASQRWAEEKTPILVLLTLRQEALSESPALQSWLHQLRRTVSVAQVKLGELSQAETEQLVRVLLTSADITTSDSATHSTLTQFSRWLFTETDGQPLFLTEALKVLVERGVVRPLPSPAPRSTGTGQASTGTGQASAGPEQTVWQLNGSRFDAQRSESGILAGVGEMIQGWLARISAPASDLLRAAAVLAQAASFDNLCHVSGLDESQALIALEELLKRQLLIEPPTLQSWASDPVYTFSHQKVSEVVYAEAGTVRRRMLHRRAFAVLQALAVPAAELAHHAFAAGLPAETIQQSLLAGNDAMTLFAVQVAITHFETARQVAAQRGWPETISGVDRQALYVGLGRAYELAEKWPQAQEIYQTMIASAQTMGAASMECLGLNHLATVYLNGLKGLPQALALLEQARRLAEQNEDRRGLAETDWNLSLASIRGRNDNLARHHGEQALATARQLGHPQFVARCLNLLSYVYAQLRRWETVDRYATEASQIYAAGGDRVLEADSQRVLGWSQAFCGQPQQSLVTLQATLRFSQQIENMWGQAECAWRLAQTWRELGHYGKAISLARQGVKQTRMVGHPTMGALALSTWGATQRTMMALAAAQATLLEVLSEFTEQGAIVTPDWVPAELCAVHALGGDWGQAHRYARQTLQAREGDSLLPITLTGWYETEALLRGGDGDLARAEVEQQSKIVGNNKRYRLPLLRSQAVLAQWDGDVGQAITHLQAALALAQEIGLPGEEWPILDALGGLYAAQGEQVQAQQVYKAAAILIHRLAGTIDEEDLRAGFLTAMPVRALLALNEFAFAKDNLQ